MRKPGTKYYTNDCHISYTERILSTFYLYGVTYTYLAKAQTTSVGNYLLSKTKEYKCLAHVRYLPSCMEVHRRNMTKDYISNMVTLIGCYSQLNKLKNAKDKSDVLSKPVTYNRANTRALVS